MSIKDKLIKDEVVTTKIREKFFHDSDTRSNLMKTIRMSIIIERNGFSMLKSMSPFTLEVLKKLDPDMYLEYKKMEDDLRKAQDIILKKIEPAKKIILDTFKDIYEIRVDADDETFQRDLDRKLVK